MTQTLYVAVREDAPFVSAPTEPTPAQTLRDKVLDGLGDLLVASGMGQPAGTAMVTARFGAENGRAEAFTRVADGPMAEELVRGALAAPGGEALGHFARAAVFHVTDTLVAEGFAWDVAHKLGAQDQIVVHFEATDGGASVDEAAYKSIEIYYDIDRIPAGREPLEFRNAAMDLVERALDTAGAGEWSGAEIGMGEVNFGFEVEDFDRAEAIVRRAVKGTPFEAIREITRFSHP